MRDLLALMALPPPLPVSPAGVEDDPTPRDWLSIRIGRRDEMTRTSTFRPDRAGSDGIISLPMVGRGKVSTLTGSVFPATLASIADGSVLLVSSGRVTPDLVQRAVNARSAARRTITSTLSTGADLSRALTMRRGDHEERMLHA